MGPGRVGFPQLRCITTTRAPSQRRRHVTNPSCVARRENEAFGRRARSTTAVRAAAAAPCLCKGRRSRVPNAALGPVSPGQRTQRARRRKECPQKGSISRQGATGASSLGQPRAPFSAVCAGLAAPCIDSFEPLVRRRGVSSPCPVCRRSCPQ